MKHTRTRRSPAQVDTTKRDEMSNPQWQAKDAIAGQPMTLKVCQMQLIKANKEPNMTTITSTLIGLRYDMARIIELLEQMR
jgi:hypothetical protein